MPNRLSERLELLASSEGLTKTDVFRRALALYLSLPRFPGQWLVKLALAVRVYY